MTKADIVNEIAKSTGTDKVLVQKIVESFMDSIKDSLMKNEPVYLRGFGSYIIKPREEKVARNISKNTTINIPAHGTPAFKPAKSFVEKVIESVDVIKEEIKDKEGKPVVKEVVVKDENGNSTKVTKTAYKLVVVAKN